MVAMNRILQVSGRIAKEFDPDKIILFGSHPYGSAAEHSDLDLLVIMPFEGSGFDKSLEILEKVNPRFPIDLIVRRPDDTEAIPRVRPPYWRCP